MTTDIRPISILTPEILASSKWWAIIGEHFTDIRLSSDLCITDNGVKGPVDIYTGNLYCTPVTVDKYGIPKTGLWPVLDGEEEILEFAAFTKRYDKWSFFGPFADTRKETTFYLEIRTGDGDVQAMSKLARPPKLGMEPVRRQGNRWVWARTDISMQPGSEHS